MKASSIILPRKPSAQPRVKNSTPTIKGAEKIQPLKGMTGKQTWESRGSAGKKWVEANRRAPTKILFAGRGGEEGGVGLGLGSRRGQGVGFDWARFRSTVDLWDRFELIKFDLAQYLDMKILDSKFNSMLNKLGYTCTHLTRLDIFRIYLS